MGDGIINGVCVRPQRIIEVENGNVLHGIKSTDEEYHGFGEAYFSTVGYLAVKGWKKHKVMTLNLVVPVGSIRFVLFDDRAGSQTLGSFQEVELSPDNYCRLTVPPAVWLAFQGVRNGVNMLLNVASVPHSPEESEIKELAELQYDWSVK